MFNKCSLPLIKEDYTNINPFYFVNTEIEVTKFCDFENLKNIK